jgi:hypothetical protein
MNVERHQIEDSKLEDLKKQFERTMAELSAYVDAARRDPRNLSLLIGRSLAALSYGCLLTPKSQDVKRVLSLASDSYTALFAAASRGKKSITVVLGEQGPVTYNSSPDESTVHVTNWIIGYFLNVLSQNRESIRLLCDIPIELVRASTTQAGNYQYLYMQALQEFGRDDISGIVNTMLAAMKATDPKLPDITDPDYTLYLHVPQIEVLIYMVTGEAKFTTALTHAVELHRKYWGKTKSRREDYEGFISLELTALAFLGRQEGLSVDVESPYLPIWLASS